MVQDGKWKMIANRFGHKASRRVAWRDPLKFEFPHKYLALDVSPPEDHGVS